MGGLQSLSEVIGSIYDCALDPDRWGQTLPSISAATDSPYGALAVYDYEHALSGRVFDHGYDESYLQRYFEKYERLNPLVPAVEKLAVGEIATTTMLVDEREFLQGIFYQEFLRHYGIRDAITAIVLRTERRISLLFGNRREEQPRYGKRDIKTLQLLVPHIRRALTISDAFDLRTLKSQAIESTLDTLSAGVFLLDAQARLVHVNRAGERQAAAGRGLQIRNHRLVATNSNAQSTLEHALGSIARSAFTDNPLAPLTIVLPAGDDVGYVANVLPLDHGQRRALLAPFAAVAAVFVQDPNTTSPLAGAAFAKLYRLTEAELRVVMTLSPGLTVREAAAFLVVSEPTIKTHLQRIFAKTGVSKQTELLRLLSNVTPPVSIG